MEQIKERNYLFDNIKAVLIFFVVSAHYVRVGGGFDSASIGGMYYIISFSFIMQGFLFVSGYFSKNVVKCRKGAVKNFLLPYFLLMPIMYLIRLLLFGHATIDFTKPTHALWFLLVMFVYRYLIKDLSKIPGIIFLSGALMLVSGCFETLGDQLALGRICSFLVFFMIGYSLKWEHVDKIRRMPKIIGIIILVALLVFSYFAAYSEAVPVEMWLLKEGYSVYGIGDIEGMIIRLVLGVVAIGWIVVFINLVPDKKVFFTEAGQRTITIYVCHIAVRYIVKCFHLPGGGGILTLVLSLALAALSLYIFSRPVVHNKYNLLINSIYDKVLMKIWRLISGGAKDKPLP